MNDDRLLIIDDEASFGNLLRRVGEACGFESIATDDPEVFRMRIKDWQPSVIALDLHMPGADGVELLRDIAAAKSAAHILIISGIDTQVLDTVHRLAAERGLSIAAALQKPVSLAELRIVLGRYREVEKPLMATALAHAIKSNALMLDYQPTLDRQSGRIVGVEALVRWKHPVRGIVPPDKFIGLAESCGLIHGLTEWVAETALKQSGEWRRQGLDLELSINISARNLENIELPDEILARCRRHHVPPQSVTLELTETAAMSDAITTMDVLSRLRLKGFRLSIDDFGTGYSSLALLQRLPFSEIKVDKSFVTQMDKAKDCRVLVEIVIELARKLDLRTVAEGAETESIIEGLFRLGCDLVQGYAISRPLPAAQIHEFVRGREYATRAAA